MKFIINIRCDGIYAFNTIEEQIKFIVFNIHEFIFHELKLFGNTMSQC